LLKLSYGYRAGLLHRTTSETEVKQLGKWWQSNRKAWANKLRNEIVKYRNIGHEWQFSNQQRRTLEQYYDATLLLADCLNNASDVTPEIRAHIEDTLLLPIAEIEKRRLSS